MLVADVTTGEIRRFLTGPAGSEVTGAATSPDGRSFFIDIHTPTADPRAATLVIRREDGGLIGT